MAVNIKPDTAEIHLEVDTRESAAKMAVIVWFDTTGKPQTVGIGGWRLSPNTLRELADTIDNLAVIDRRA